MEKTATKSEIETGFANYDLIWFGNCKGQIGPDDKPCAICDSAQHYAFTCPNNVFLNWLETRRIK